MTVSIGVFRSPQNGKSFKVLIVARISTDQQDPRSLADQIAQCQEEVARQYPGAVVYTIMQSQGSGEHLDRKELEELKDLIDSREFDLVIVEDLARICRRNRALDFCEQCQDCETRLVAINDHVDTDEEGWEDAATMACWHHARSNRDTSKRIKRSLNNRFDQGQLIERPIYGYIVPVGARNDSEVRKDTAAEPIIREIFRRLEDGAGYSEVGDWLNQQQIPTGPYCRNKQWNCASVSRFVHSRILRGERSRNRLFSKRNNKTGRHLSRKAPASMLRLRKCVHLAFFDAVYYDHVIRVLDERNAKYRRAKDGKPDGRAGVARSRSSFPGQHIACGICGRQLYWTRCGLITGFLCSGAQNYTCWNSLLLAAEPCLNKIINAVTAEIRSIPDFDEILGAAVARQRAAEPDDRIKRQKELERRLQTAEAGVSNVVRGIESAPTSSALIQRLTELEGQVAELQYELSLLKEVRVQNDAPPTLNELSGMVDALFGSLITDDPEAGRILRRLIPVMYVLPYRCCDGKSTEARLHLTINLAALLGTMPVEGPTLEVVTRHLVIDLFDPPQRVTFRQAVKELAPHHKERDIAASLGIKQATVQHAKRLDCTMEELGLDDPYVRLTEPLPKGKSRMRRHFHVRYNFHPLDGFPLT